MFSANLQSALSCALLATVLLAVKHDVLEHKIPNVVCAVALLSGCVIHTLASGFSGLAFALQGAAVGLALFLPLYALRGMGAGDVKLMCAVGSFLGPLDTLFAAAIALTVGGVIGIGIVVVRLVQRARASDAPLAASSGPLTATPINKHAFPYAVAIAAGAVLLMWRQGGFVFLTGMLAG